MFIYNVKVSGTKLFKTFAIIVSIIVIILFGMSIYKIFFGIREDSPYADYTSSSINSIDPKNYTFV